RTSGFVATHTAPAPSSPLSLHDALPISLGPDFSESIGIIKALLDGAMPAVPRIHFGLVDVRDVADLHLRAMTSPKAKGERFLARSEEHTSELQSREKLVCRLLLEKKRSY